MHTTTTDRTAVPVADTFDMLGPYLTATATCPTCQHPNVLVHIESYASPVKVVDTCRHLRALARDDEGGRFLEFANVVS